MPTVTGAAITICNNPRCLSTYGILEIPRRAQGAIQGTSHDSRECSPGASPVSSKWNKPQLAGVPQRCIDETQVLPNPEQQHKLYLEVKSTSGRHKVNKIFTHEEGYLRRILTKVQTKGLSQFHLLNRKLTNPFWLRWTSSVQYRTSTSKIRRVHNVDLLNELMELVNNCETAGIGSEDGDEESFPSENPKTGMRISAEQKLVSPQVQPLFVCFIYLIVHNVILL